MKLLVATSTFPISDDDKVPAFVKDQVVEFKRLDPSIEITVLAPHNYYGKTVENLSDHQDYTEIRYHYFRPYRLELLAGRAIMPTLKQNKLLYLQVPFFVVFHFWALLRQTRKTKPDIIYVHWFMPQAIAAAVVSKITKTPFVFTTHASDVAVLYKFPFAKPLIRWVCRAATNYTAVSQRTTDKLKRAFSETEWENNYAQKLSIIPMGVHTSNPKKDKVAEAKLQKDHYLPTDKKLFVFIGRLAEKKGVTYLLDAIPLLNQKTRDASHFVIAGDGQLMTELQTQAKSLGLTNVTFVGYIHGKEKDTLINMADYMVFPSIIDSMNDSEGFPVAIMESLAAGKIVLGSDVSGAETIFDSGKNGFVFAEKSPSKLAKTIEQAFAVAPKTRTSIEKVSLALAKRYSWGKIAKEHLDVLKLSLKQYRANTK